MIIFRNKPNPAWWTTTAISFQRALDILEIIVIFVAIYFLFFWNPWNGKGGLLRHGIYDTEEVKKEANTDADSTKDMTAEDVLKFLKNNGNSLAIASGNGQAQVNNNYKIVIENGDQVISKEESKTITPPPPKEEGKKKDDDTIGGGGNKKTPPPPAEKDPWEKYKNVKIIAQTKTLTNGNGDGQNQAIIGRSDGCEGCD